MLVCVSGGDLCSHREEGHITNCGATQFIYPKCDKLAQLTCPLAMKPTSSGTISIPNFWATHSRHIFLKPQKCLLFHPKSYPPLPFRKKADASTELCCRNKLSRQDSFQPPLLTSCLPPARHLPHHSEWAPLVLLVLEQQINAVVI